MKLEVVEVKPVDPPKEYVLTLNQNELDLITVCLGGVRGYDGPSGWRELLNKIYPELHQKTKIKHGILRDVDSQFPSDRNRVVPEV
jgi:hypothetical protein